MKKGLILSAILTIPLYGADLQTDIPQGQPEEIRQPDMQPRDLEQAESFSSYAKAIDIFLKNRKFDENAVKAVLEAVRKSPESKELIQITFSSGNKFTQDKIFRDGAYLIAKENPQAAALVISTASLLIRHDKDKAKEILLQSLNKFDHDDLAEKDPNAYVAFVVLLAEIYASENNLKDGDRIFSKALDLPKVRDNFVLLRNATEFYTELGAKADAGASLFFMKSEKEKCAEKAQKSLQRLEVLASAGDSPATKLAPLIRIFRETGNPEKAVSIIVSSLIARPDDTELMMLLADAYSENESYILALRVWKKLFSEHKIQARFYLNMGITAMKAQNYPEAVTAFEKYLIAYPENKTVYYSLSVALLSSGNPAKALNAISKTQENYESDYIKAMAYLKMDDYKNALFSLISSQRKASVQKDSKFLNRAFYLTTAFVADKAGDYETAVKMLSPLLEQDPDDHEVLNFIAYSWADKGINLDKASEYLAKALKLQPENPAYLDSMAWLYFRKGDTKEALDLIKKALEKDGSVPDATVIDHAGDIYAANGDMKSAVRCWKSALEIYSKETRPDEILKKIKDARQDIP